MPELAREIREENAAFEAERRKYAEAEAKFAAQRRISEAKAREKAEIEARETGAIGIGAGLG